MSRNEPKSPKGINPRIGESDPLRRKTGGRVLTFKVASDSQANMLRRTAASIGENLSVFLRIAALERMDRILAERLRG